MCIINKIKSHTQIRDTWRHLYVIAPLEAQMLLWGRDEYRICDYFWIFIFIFIFLDELPSSVILQRENSYLSQLKQFLPTKYSWLLCWRATRDGWAGNNFHSKCNYKGPTVTIVRVGNYVLGGYTDVSWDSKIFSIFLSMP